MPATRAKAQRIERRETDDRDAGFDVVPSTHIDPTTALTRVEKAFDTKGAKLRKDPEASEALRQGFRGGTIQPLKNASAADKLSALKMTTIAKKAKNNERYGMENRGSDVAGDVLMGRLESVRAINKRAGRKIGSFVKDKLNHPIDARVAGNEFVSDLAAMGISIDQATNKLTFKGSEIEGAKGAENVIEKVVTRLREGIPNAKALHNLKGFIDENVTYGKNAEGLAGKAERALKKFRRNINETLGAQFPEYKKANRAYSDTIKALDAFQDVAGRKMNLLGENADKATGTLMRRLMGNAQSRVTLLDSIKEIEGVIKNHSDFGGLKQLEGSGLGKNDLLMLTLYANELDRVFGQAPRTSLQGSFDQSFHTAAKAATSKAGLVEASIDVAGKGIEYMRGINDDNAFKAIEELLKRDM
jgi:hypothetical protein